jgi:hypothetical protein
LTSLKIAFLFMLGASIWVYTNPREAKLQFHLLNTPFARAVALEAWEQLGRVGLFAQASPSDTIVVSLKGSPKL